MRAPCRSRRANGILVPAPAVQRARATRVERRVIIPSIDSFLSYVDSVRGRTRRVVAAIPPERIEWTHRDGAFTLGDIVRHIGATERYMFAETARGNVSAYPGHGRELADGYDAVVAYLDHTHEEALEIYRDADAGGVSRPVHHSRGDQHLHVEVASRDGRARDPSPRTAVSDARHAWRSDAAAVRAHRRTAS